MGRRAAQHAPPDVLVVRGVVGVADDIQRKKGGLRSGGGGGGHKLQLQFRRICVATKVSWFFFLHRAVVAGLVWLD